MSDQAEPKDDQVKSEGELELPAEYVLHGAKGQLKVKFVVPGSLATRYEVAHAATKSDVRAFCAALGLCSAAIRNHVKPGHDLMQFGGQVLEWLLGEGVSFAEVYRAGNWAWLHVSKGLVGEREVKAAEGFSDPKPEGSTSS